MPLMYNGVESMINRCSKFYGSEITKPAEDDNVQILFELLGIKKSNKTFNMVTGQFEGSEKVVEEGQAGQAGDNQAENGQNPARFQWRYVDLRNLLLDL